MACLTYPIIGGSSPVDQGRSPRTTGPVMKQDSDSFPILSRTPSPHVSRTKLMKPPSSPPSSDIPYDPIIKRIVPPDILPHLHGYVKSARRMPKPYERSGPSIVERLFSEECSGCSGSKDPLDVQRERTRSQRILERLAPEALAHAVLAIRADIEWRRVRTIAAALRVDAVEKHSKFLELIADSEAETFVNAASEPLETATEAIASCTADELNDRRDRGTAAFNLDVTSFAADTEFDRVENVASALLDSVSDGSTSSDEETSGDN